ncbi:protein delta homolog 2 [Lates japonicus]|uniref:Protein delta homolog 2 n=1 Tax=Lates japonicus TaxID=270547 RepID=A0AAD3MLE3_LATJO|nr:protein delta homolog 2 [Lates japonicus]
MLLLKGQSSCRSDCSLRHPTATVTTPGSAECDPGWEPARPSCQPACQCPGACTDPVSSRGSAACASRAGRFCDKDLSVCSEQPIRSRATCVMEDSGEYTCLCPEGFHGRDCQLKTGPCHQRRPSSCETDVDDCLMRPCGNGATCLDGVNRFSRPCLNAGRCLDRAGGFHCVCRPGFTGTTCETPPKDRNARRPGWTTLGWEGGGGGGVRHHLTTVDKNQRSGGNSSRHDERLFRVTVSERRDAAGLSEVQLIVLLVLAGLTLGVVALTAALVLQGHCRNCGHAPCWTLTLSLASERGQKRGRRAQQHEEEEDCQINFLNATEPEKKKLNTEVI